MLTNLINHLYPNTIDEVLEMLGKPNSMLIAGGTGLSLERNDTLETLIDLQNVNLSYIRDEGNYFAIGSMTSAQEIYNNEKLPNSLRYAANCVGDTPIMHAVTIGGNLAKIYYWVDLPPILWALNASFVIYNPERRVMTADEFFEYAGQKNISSRRNLISEIQIPKSPDNSFSEYQSFMTTENEKSQLSLASYFEWNEKKELTITRLVVSGVIGSPSRISVVETKLNGVSIKDIDLDELTSLLQKDIKLISSYKTSKEYRKHILAVYLKRTIKQLEKITEGAA